MSTAAHGQQYTSAAPRRAFAPLSSQASAHLNMLRAVAAFAVLLGHWRNLFFVDWPDVRGKNFVLEVFYFLTKFGHEAVVVFFVLSGYLIGRSVVRAIRDGKWSVKHYAFHRLIRLELVLLPALILCWMWDMAGLRLFPHSPIYMGTSGITILLYKIPEWISLPTFLGNAAFLQTILVTPFGSDAPLWSLANEFWYYVLFPCMVMALLPQFGKVKRLLSASLLIATALFIGKWMFGGFFIWLLGVALIFLPGLRRLRGAWYLAFFALSGFLVFAQLLLTADPRKMEGKIDTDYIIGPLVAILLYALLHAPHHAGKTYEKFAKRTAGFSYTLYLTHLPLLVFCAAWMRRREQPNWKFAAIPLVILCVTVAYSYGVAMLFEHRTDSIRKRLETKFNL